MISAIFKTFFLSLCIIANTHLAMAQTASILPPAKTQYLDNSGKPLTSGKVFNYIPSTTTFKTTWQDAAETIANTNPVILDAGGRAKILGEGSYRQIVKDRYDNIIWDAVTSSSGSGGGGSTATGDGDLVGTIKPWAGMTAPNQYAFTYGQEVSRTTYATLFTAITSSQAVFCTSASPILTGLTDTTNVGIGAPVEVSCIAAGFAYVTAKTSTTLTLGANANITTNTTAVIFPWGRGNGTTTFNLPDFRGVPIAGNNNMGGVASSVTTSLYFGTDPNAINSLGGAESTVLVNSNLPSYTPSGTITNGAITITQNALINNNSSSTPGGGFSIPSAGAATISASQATSTFNGTAQGGTSVAFSRFQPTKTSNFIIKITPDTNSATASGVTSIQGMTGDIACGSGLICTGNIISSTGATANPTAQIGLTAINGVAATSMRSDAAPALSQSIVPTWASFHTFNAGLSSTFVTTPTVYGGGDAGSDLSLQTTTNGSPSGDLLTLTGSLMRFQNFGTSRAYYDFYDHFARSQMQLRGIVKRDVDNVRSIAGIINPGFAIDDGVQRVGDIDFLVCGTGGVANADCNGLGTGETLQAGLAIIGPVTGLGGGGLIPFTDDSYIIGWPSQRFKDLQVVTGTFGGILTAELGVVVSGGGVQISNANTLNWANGSYLYGAATTGAIANTFRLVGSGTATALNFGGDTASFPALIQNSTTLKVRLANDTADAALTALSFNGLTVSPSTGTLTVANAKTLTASNTVTFTATDGATLAIGAGGTLGSNAYTSTAYAPLASPTFTGTVTIPTPFTLGATSVTTNGTRLNYLTSATGTTGTASSNVVFSASPTLTGTLTAATISASGTILGSGGLFTADGASIGFGASTASIVGNSAANVFAFYTASTERLRIQASGGISVGTATDPGVGAIIANTTIKATTGYQLTNLLSSSTAPVATTFCTSPSIPANNGTAAFTINVGTACATSTGTITMPTATTGWVCNFANVTVPASNVPSQTGGTTTTVTLTNYARTTGLASNWTDSNVIRAMCSAY